MLNVPYLKTALYPDKLYNAKVTIVRTHLSAGVYGERLDRDDFVIEYFHEPDFSGEAHQDGVAVWVHRHTERLIVKLLKLLQRAAEKKQNKKTHPHSQKTVTVN